MPRGIHQRRIMNLLNGPGQRGRWLDTRAIAHVIFETDWASQEQMATARQSLRRLEVEGEIERFGYMGEWRSARYPEVEEPLSLRRVRAILEEE